MSETHQQALWDVLRWRRDVRHFRPDPLPHGFVDLLREALEMAPSVGNARPWRVIETRDPKLRQSVRASFERCNRAAQDSYADADRSDYMQLKLAGLDAAPLQLAVFTETAPPEGRGLGRQTMPETLQQSTVMAIHTMWLMARAHDVGLGMVSILAPQEMERLYEVPDSWRFTAYLCLGYPETEDDTPLLHRAGWQENTTPDWEVR